MPIDLPHGLQLSLPISDYYSFRMGRIEGRGVEPDVAVPAGAAMDEAMARVRR
jgi:C-terminal processing protease CtpA/Prc